MFGPVSTDPYTERCTTTELIHQVAATDRLVLVLLQAVGITPRFLPNVLEKSV
jgi:hypothetical protein